MIHNGWDMSMKVHTKSGFKYIKDVLLVICHLQFGYEYCMAFYYIFHLAYVSEYHMTVREFTR